MISDSQIRNLINKYRTTEVNVEREYVQHLFLSYFYQEKTSAKIFFKGGTALRLLYNSPRFSADLDFSTPFAGLREIEKPIQEAFVAIEREGIRVNLAESKETSGGYLGIIELEPGQRKIKLQINISMRSGKAKGELMTVVNDFIPVYTVLGLERKTLFEEKIEALMSRQKARDFYDLYFLLRANLLVARNKKVLQRIVSLVKKSNIKFEKELTLFLPKSHSQVIRDFKDNLLREIETAVGG